MPQPECSPARGDFLIFSRKKNYTKILINLQNKLHLSGCPLATRGGWAERVIIMIWISTQLLHHLIKTSRIVDNCLIWKCEIQISPNPKLKNSFLYKPSISKSSSKKRNNLEKKEYIWSNIVESWFTKEINGRCCRYHYLRGFDFMDKASYITDVFT